MAKVIVSGGFDPIHTGHLDMFKQASKYGDVIIALNSDVWIVKKKGRTFMEWEDRSRILKAFSIVSEVINFKDDKVGTANNAIKKVRKMYPKEDIYFANGGDRVAENVPEAKACEKAKAVMIWGIGGLKTRSSSLLLEAYGATEVEDKRKWGSFRVLSEVPGYKVKELTILPFKSLSLQSHEYRAEHWTVIEGTAQVWRAGKIFELRQNETTYIPIRCKHKLANSNNVPLKIIEVQVGTYLGEDDIKRFEE